MNNNIRKLSSIRKIDEIRPIKDADRIEVAKIGGWNVIVKKGEFKEGDLCVYCEIDCLLPEKPEFEFLRSKHFRIKTIKMKNQLSQGIIFPLCILGNKCNDFKVGTEVTEQLGIKKYEAPISPQLMGMAKGNFPTHIIPKTDEERIQNCLGVLDELKGKLCYITQKEDGTSFTAYHNVEVDMNPEDPGLKEVFGVCSRNLELKNESFPGSDVNVYWKIAKQYDIENKLKDYYHNYGVNLAIQGEICGDGINKNPLGLSRNTQQLHIFNIWNIDEQKYLDYELIETVCSELGIPMVETIYFGRFNFTLEELLKMAEGKYTGTNNEREGIVIRPDFETFSETLQGRLSFKVINNLYLLKES
jgi:RNA ligase (TIGR02306 family)